MSECPFCCPDRPVRSNSHCGRAVVCVCVCVCVWKRLRRFLRLIRLSTGQRTRLRQTHQWSHPVYIAPPPPLDSANSPDATFISPGWFAIIFSNAFMYRFLYCGQRSKSLSIPSRPCNGQPTHPIRVYPSSYKEQCGTFATSFRNSQTSPSVQSIIGLTVVLFFW